MKLKCCKISSTSPLVVYKKDMPLSLQRRRASIPTKVRTGVKRPSAKKLQPTVKEVEEKGQGERLVPGKRSYREWEQGGEKTSRKCQAKYFRKSYDAKVENIQKQVIDKNIEDQQVFGTIDDVPIKKPIASDVTNFKKLSKSIQTDASVFVKEDTQQADCGSNAIVYREGRPKKVVVESFFQPQVLKTKNVMICDYERDRNMRVKDGIAYFTNIWGQSDHSGKKKKQSNNNVSKKNLDITSSWRCSGGGITKLIQPNLDVASKPYGRDMASGDAPAAGSTYRTKVVNKSSLNTQVARSSKPAVCEEARPIQSVRKLVQFFTRENHTPAPGGASHMTDTASARAWRRSKTNEDEGLGVGVGSPGMRMENQCTLILEAPFSKTQAPSSCSSVRNLVDFFNEMSQPTEGSRMTSRRNKSVTCPRCSMVFDFDDREILRNAAGEDQAGAQLEWDYEWEGRNSSCRINSTFIEGRGDYSVLDILANITPMKTQK